MTTSQKIRFLLSNLLKGIIWLAVLAGLYLLFVKYIFATNPEAWIDRFYSQPAWIYLIYLGSEFFFGLFPPEIFMLWAFNKGSLAHYWMNVAFFAAVSYGMGYLAFMAGKYLRKVVTLRYLQRRFLSKYWPLLRKYGAFLIIVAALTPLPWSAICLMVGSTNYLINRFLLIALSRIFRFGAYAFIIMQAHAAI